MVSRQVLRAQARANGYWGAPNHRGMSVPIGARKCRRPGATDRGRVSVNVIQPSKTKRRAYKPRFPKGLMHAWQRKAAALEALR